MSLPIAVRNAGALEISPDATVSVELELLGSDAYPEGWGRESRADVGIVPREHWWEMFLRARGKQTWLVKSSHGHQYVWR